MTLDAINLDHFTPHGMAEADKSLLVKFFIKPRPDNEATEREGRPVFKDVEHIDIQVPGNRGVGACRPATEADKMRFPEHYRLFKARMSQDIGMGTPLSEWGQVTRSQAEELAFFNIKTVEQLAAMADTQIANFMGGYQLKEKAKRFIEIAKQEAPLYELEKQIKFLQEENADLRTSLQQVLEKLEAVGEDRAERNKGGRPRKYV